MWDEWSIADTVNAEDLQEKDVVHFPDQEEDFVCVIVRREDETRNTVTYMVDNETTGERGEVTLDWDAQVNVLVRDYSGVEV